MPRFRFFGLIILGVWVQTTNATPIPSSGEIIRSLPQAPFLQRPQTELRLEAESLDDLIPGGDTLVVNEIKSPSRSDNSSSMTTPLSSELPVFLTLIV